MRQLVARLVLKLPLKTSWAPVPTDRSGPVTELSRFCSSALWSVRMICSPMRVLAHTGWSSCCQARKKCYGCRDPS